MVRPGLEPGAFCVLDRCDNQLRHRTLSRAEPSFTSLLALLIVKPASQLLDYNICLPWPSLACGYVFSFVHTAQTFNYE
jgi:hypothetical protein